MEGNKIKITHRKKARIEIIPLIDVIFFLLATFVLFTLSLNRIVDIDVTLPQAAQKSEPNKDAVTLQVSSDGALYWNREAIDMADLPGRLTAYISQTPEENRAVMVTSDEKAKFGSVVAVLDEIRRQHIDKFSVATATTGTGR
ncbi:MAG TPA: biopolymer transporter ExbD [Candidatus Didemnitutus sp.]|nr:biopolymer transporter ExbD [Candidatus Didemnitutus sp.]